MRTCRLCAGGIFDLVSLFPPSHEPNRFLGRLLAICPGFCHLATEAKKKNHMGTRRWEFGDNAAKPPVVS